METPTGVPSPDRPARPEARQRWRLTFCRDLGPGEQSSVGRDYLAAWEEALVGSELPIAESAAGRLRFSLAAPLPASAAGEAELAELWLTSRLPAWRLREALTPLLPAGHRITGLEDVWLAAPALAGRIAAADYRVTLADGLDARSVTAAARRLLDARSIPREKSKAGVVRTYDLRPLIIAIDTSQAVDHGPIVLRIRARIHPELGSGRPEEVLAVLADELGAPLEPAATVRERLVLADEI